MKRKSAAALILVVGMLSAARADLAEYVNPFVGTTATGHTTPAAAYPFGMVQAGPTTGTIAWQYCSGYRYEDKAVTGYALTALSGTGFCEYNELQVLPFSGACGALPMKREIDKTAERAEPGYYAVRQPTDGVTVEIAAAKRAAIYRFAWEKGRRAKVLVNLPYGNGQADGNQFAGSHDGRVTKFGDGRIEGEHFRTGCIMRRKIAFALEFSRPWSACAELPKEKPDELPRYVLTFDLADGEALYLKSAFSINTPDAARRNLISSIPSWDFDGVRDRTRAAWNEVLSRSTCEGTDEQKRNWYTSLYHLYFQPNDYSDADEAKPYYTTLSLWDTFRACHPWYSIVTPEVNAGAVDSFIRHYRTFGRLPVMSYGGMNFDCMIGNHAVPVLVDRFLKTKSDEVDWNQVFDAVKNTLTKAHLGKPNEDWAVYDKYGYFPLDRVEREGVSRTLECAYDDWCASEMAKRLGREADAAFFLKRSQNWKNVFDRRIGFARGKTADGAWREPFDPFAFGHGGLTNKDFTEGNAFQYSWHVQHDFQGLVEAMGGRGAALAKLKGLFVAHDTTEGAPPDVTGLIGQYVHGNEPSHHVIYAFTLLGRPDLTATYVREVFDRFYFPKPDGLCGNDDCGQMSAWYLFSAMGFYPFNPCGGEYVLGAPQVPAAEVKVGGEGEQRTFRVLAKNLSKENKYVKSVTLNGKPVTDGKIRHADIMSGGVLAFEMWDGKMSATRKATELSVMTWNTEHYGWWNRSAAECELIESNLFAVVRAVAPDVLLVIETYGSFERFKKALPEYEARPFGSCNSVFSRYPIVSTYDTYREKTLYGCTNGWDYAGETGPFHFAVAELDVGGRRVRVCPLAMNWQPSVLNFPANLDADGLLAAEAGPQPNGGTPRPQAMKDILASVRDLLDETDRIPIVIGGDFNSHSHLDWTAHTSHHFGHGGRVVPWPVSQTMAAAGFVDTYRALHPDPVSNYGTTFMRSSPTDPKKACYARIDYIYSKGDSLVPIRSEAFNGSYHEPFEFKGARYTCFPSDHGFLVTTFKLKEGEE